jgi:hypothetical protein
MPDHASAVMATEFSGQKTFFSLSLTTVASAGKILDVKVCVVSAARASSSELHERVHIEIVAQGIERLPMFEQVKGLMNP